MFAPALWARGQRVVGVRTRQRNRATTTKLTPCDAWPPQLHVARLTKCPSPGSQAASCLGWCGRVAPCQQQQHAQLQPGFKERTDSYASAPPASSAQRAGWAQGGAPAAVTQPGAAAAATEGVGPAIGSRSIFFADTYYGRSMSRLHEEFAGTSTLELKGIQTESKLGRGWCWPAHTPWRSACMLRVWGGEGNAPSAVHRASPYRAQGLPPPLGFSAWRSQPCSWAPAHTQGGNGSGLHPP